MHFLNIFLQIWKVYNLPFLDLDPQEYDEDDQDDIRTVEPENDKEEQHGDYGNEDFEEYNDDNLPDLSKPERIATGSNAQHNSGAVRLS